MNGELDVGSPRGNPDLADHRQRGVPEDLVFPVRQGLGGRDGDRVSRVDPHGVDVLDGTDDDHVVLLVPHDLQLEFLPAEDRLLDEDFPDQALFHPELGELLEFLLVEGHGTARPPEGEAGADDHGKAEFPDDRPGFLHGPGDFASGHFQADFRHGLLEFVPVLRPPDGRPVGADHLHAVPVEDPLFRRLDGDVERRLATDGGQDRLGPFLGDDLLDHVDGDRLYVGPVGHLGIGHDGRRVRVEKDHLVPFLEKGLAGLGARIVELAGLSDDDGTGADDEDFLQIGAPGHERIPCPIPIRWCSGAWN